MLSVKRLLSALFFLCLSAQCTYAQPAKTGNWLVYSGNQMLSKKMNWWNEVQYRNYNAIGDLQQLLLRTGIGYNLSDNNNNILLGYAYVYSENYIGETDQKNSTEEHRIYQQFLTRQNFKRLALLHRYRLEERFINDDTEVRFRYALSILLPITKPSLSKGALYGIVTDEIFINAKGPAFDRNRFYTGIGYVFHKNFRAEAGWMIQTLEPSERKQFQISLINTFPLFNSTD